MSIICFIRRPTKKKNNFFLFWDSCFILLLFEENDKFLLKLRLLYYADLGDEYLKLGFCGVFFLCYYLLLLLIFNFCVFGLIKG